MDKSKVILIVFVVFQEARTVEVFMDETPQHQLYEHIFSRYNSNLRPRINISDTVEVGIEFELNTVNDLDEVNQVMQTVGFIVAKWMDQFLTWNLTEYNIERIVVPASTVWLPDIGVKNSANAFYDPSFTRDFRVDIRHDGRITWAFGGMFETTCTLDMTHYPFDMQKCPIDIENWAYTSDLVDLEPVEEEVHLVEFSENGQWALDHSSGKLDYFEEDTHPGKEFPRVRYALYITRKYTYFMVNIILPALFVIAISLTVFWLPPESGEKVSLGITVLLSFSVFQLIIMDNTPRTSDFTPVMTTMFTIIMGVTTFSVITSVAMLYFYHHGAHSRVPKLIRYLAFKVCARVLMMSSSMPQETQIKPQKTIRDAIEIVEVDSDDVVDISNMKKPIPRDGGNESTAAIKELLRHVRRMTQRSEEAIKAEQIMAEWKALAIVMDRIFFWIAFLVVIITCPYILADQDESHGHK